MKLGVFTCLLGNLPFEQALEYFKSKGIEMVEIGCGGYPGNSHANPEELLSDPKKLEDFKALIKKYDMEISALSCHGNPVHPNKKLAAEYDNYRKRTAKERDDAFTNAKVSVFSELIPVLDNFDRAMSTEESELANFKKGVEMTHTQLKSVFEKFGVSEFGEAGEVFDPNFHNAVMHIDDDTLSANVITEVFQKGYKTGDKILRPAMVKVAN